MAMNWDSGKPIRIQQPFRSRESVRSSGTARPADVERACTPIRIRADQARLDLTPGEQEGAVPAAAMGVLLDGLILAGDVARHLTATSGRSIMAGTEGPGNRRALRKHLRESRRWQGGQQPCCVQSPLRRISEQSPVTDRRMCAGDPPQGQDRRRRPDLEVRGDRGRKPGAPAGRWSGLLPAPTARDGERVVLSAEEFGPPRQRPGCPLCRPVSRFLTGHCGGAYTSPHSISPSPDDWLKGWVGCRRSIR